MIERYEYGGITWLDVLEPSSEEIRTLMYEYDLPPTVAEELMLPSLRPRAELHPEGLLYLVLHFPALRHTNSQSRSQEVDFVLTRDTLITVRYDTVDALHKFSKLFEVRSILLDRGEVPHAGHIFFAMVMKLYRSIGHELDYIRDKLEDIEKHIFEGREREMVVALSHTSRDLLRIKQALFTHEPVLESLRESLLALFGAEFENELSAIEGEFYRISSLRTMNGDTLWELRKTNEDLLTTKQNEIMKKLTLLAFVTLPLSVMAGLFGMNARYIPLIGNPFDFWVIVLLMVSSMLLLAAYFKRKGWF